MKFLRMDGEKMELNSRLEEMDSCIEQTTKIVNSLKTSLEEFRQNSKLDSKNTMGTTINHGTLVFANLSDSPVFIELFQDDELELEEKIESFGKEDFSVIWDWSGTHTIEFIIYEYHSPELDYRQGILSIHPIKVNNKSLISITLNPDFSSTQLFLSRK